MPHWLQVVLVVAGSLTTLLAFGSTVRSKIVRPLVNGWHDLITLLGQIKDASTGVQKLAREVEGLAGAVANFVVGIKEQVDQHTTRLDRLEEMRELVVDLQADLDRHLRDPGGHS